MNERLGVKTVWECMSCGMLMSNQNILKKDGFPTTKEIKPDSCSCGAKNFKLVDFDKCKFVLLPDGYVVVPKSETIEESLKPENNTF